MTDVDRCVCCGQEIPEGVHICRRCSKVASRNEAPHAEELRESIRNIKNYCAERRGRLGKCGECPIKIACLNIIPLWED